MDIADSHSWMAASSWALAKWILAFKKPKAMDFGESSRAVLLKSRAEAMYSRLWTTLESLSEIFIRVRAVRALARAESGWPETRDLATSSALMKLLAARNSTTRPLSSYSEDEEEEEAILSFFLVLFALVGFGGKWK